MKTFNIKFLLFAISTGFAFQAFALWQDTGSSQATPVDIKVISSDQNETILEYRVLGFDLQNVEINGNKYSSLQIPAASLEDKAGYPALPRVSKNIHIPAGAKTTLEVEKLLTQDFAVLPVVPSKGALTRDVDPKSVVYTFSPEIYASKKNLKYPESRFKNGKEFMLRSARGVNLSFYPIQYLPALGIIRVTTHAVVKIKTESKFRAQTKVDTLDVGWANILKESFLNNDMIKELSLFSDKSPQSLDPKVSHYIADTGRVLVLSPAQFKESLTPWINWKTQKGLHVSLKEISSTSTYKDIKAIIQSAYESDKISYVVLVGDAEFLAFHPGTSGNAKGNEADPMYGLVEGSDSYPDLVVSRFSVKNSLELDTMIAKSINYEKSPDLQGDWYSKGVGIASNEGSPTDWQRLEVIREILEGWNYTAIDKQYEPTASKGSLIKQINEGRGFINYTGHGSNSSWVTTGFSTRDVDALQNTGKLPFIVSVACVNGDFDSGSDSFAERWLKAGTPEDSRGAVAIFASSTNQSWDPPTVGQLEISTLLAAEKMNTVGSLFFHGSIAVLEDNSSTAQQTFETWHIFGDATTQVRTKAPSPINFSNANLDLENGELVIQVSEKGIQAGLMQGSKLLGAAISDELGNLRIKVASENITSQAAILTLTGYNKTPLIKEIVLN